MNKRFMVRCLECSSCCANGMKCSYCGAHGTGEYCTAADCERVGAELERNQGDISQGPLIKDGTSNHESFNLSDCFISPGLWRG
jgi:hypothetical protein